MRVGHQVIFDQGEDVLTEASELCLELFLVDLDLVNVFSISLVVLLLLNGRENSPGRSSGADDILEGDGKDVSLFEGQLLATSLGKLSGVTSHFYNDEQEVSI